MTVDLEKETGFQRTENKRKSEEEERKDPPLESSERASPCGHLDVRLLVSGM